MFYGRVDIYWPDRPVESYRLNKDTIAVGRSTGNDIVLDTTTISRYHITFTFKNQQALLEDLESVNGTYVDSVRLRASTPFVLRGGEEIQIGEIRLIYHPPGPFESGGSEDTTQRIVLSQPTYRIQLDGPDMAVAPGAHVQAALTVKNVSEDADRYFVEIDGLPKGWARADRVEVPLEAGEETQVVISFKPLRRSESRPGEHPFVVRVRSKSRPADTIDAQTVLHVLPFSGFGMALGDIVPEQNDSFKLYLHNQGNAPLPLVIQGTDKVQALQIDILGGQVQLGPGERRTLTGTIKSRRRRWFGAEREHEFAVLARSQDASGFLAAIPGRYAESGRFPAWTPVLAVPLMTLFVLLLVGFALLLFGGDDDTPGKQPVIQFFGLEEIEKPVMPGDQVVVNWAVVDAERVTLAAHHALEQRQFPLEQETGAYVLSFEYTGVHQLTLEAWNGDASVTAIIQVDVQPVVMFTLDVLNGTELVRHVQHDVRIQWSVVGAKEYQGGYNIWVESTAHSAPLFIPPMPLTGEQTISLVLEDDAPVWAVTLYAEGQDQVVASMTQEIPVVFPICELQAEQTIVRSGPGETYPALLPPQPSADTPGSTLSYSPVARDPSGEWLRVVIGVDAARYGWVLREDFTCTNFDFERLLITADFPPPPDSAPVVEATETAAPPATGTLSPASPTPFPPAN